MVKKRTIEEVAEIFALEGHTLLSAVYEDIRKPMKCLCPNGHEWFVSLFDFTQGYSKCPCMSKRKVWEKYSALSEYPEVVDDWDYALNYPLRPEDVTPGSGKKVWWLCDRCAINHSYKQSVNHHLGNNRKCPFYRGRKAGYGNDLYTNYKGMCDLEWDWEKNNKLPSEYTTRSHSEVWWVCNSCGVKHSYLKRIAGKVRGRGCPYFAGKKVGYGNSLSYNYPDLAQQWDFSKNKKSPWDYTWASHKIVCWKHRAVDGTIHRWKTSIKNRTLGETGCPHCVCGDVSKISQKWLDSFKNNNILREYWILIGKRRFKVDGFELKTNTVYEFLGDYWHGNPELERFSSEDINPHNKKTFKELYKETVERIGLLEKNGYKVVYIWEKDFLNSIK